MTEAYAAFEEALARDIPRGLARPPKAMGADRGLYARWLTPAEMTGELWQTDGGLRLGYRQGRIIGWTDNRHLLTIAGSRAGKGVSMIIPNLIEYQGSMLVVDPKGENAARTAKRRGQGPEGGKGLGQTVKILDPFGEARLWQDSYNPMDALDPKSPEIIEDIGIFADALIVSRGDKDSHWTESAQGLLRALILLVAMDSRFESRRTLMTVRQLLMLTDAAIRKVQEAFEERTDKTMPAQMALIEILLGQETMPYGYVCVGAAEQLQAMGENERGSVLSEARTQTQWLDSPKMTTTIETSNFKLETLKREKMTLYLCLPASRMATHARWLRLMILLALNMMEQEKADPPLPVLFVLDEFPVLGYMQAIEKAAGLMAGYGVKLWPIVQNIGQLKQHYPASWETFFANAGVVTAFGLSDSESLKTLSDYLGHISIRQKSESGVSFQALSQAASPLKEERLDIPLLAPDELRIILGRGTGRMLVFNMESHPAIVRRFVYHDAADQNFAGKFDPDPKFRRPS